MAQSTLTITYGQLKDVVGRMLFGKRDDVDADTLLDAERADIHEAITAGLRRFLNPDPLDGETKAHEWSFLRPTTSIVVWPDTDYDSSSSRHVDYGALDANSNTTPVTRFGAETWVFYPGMVGATLTTAGGTSYTISHYTSASAIRVQGDASGETDNGVFDIAHNGSFGLPDNFGGISGNVTYSATTGFPPIVVTSQSYIRDQQMNARNPQVARPRYAAIRPVLTPAGKGEASGTPAALSISTRWQMMLWPSPGEVHTLYYQYLVTPEHLTTLASGGVGPVPTETPLFDFPPGGSQFSQCLAYACLAYAEQWGDTPATRFEELYLKSLRAAIYLDRQAGAPDYVPYNDDAGMSARWSRGTNQHEMNVTYNSVQYP